MRVNDRVNEVLNGVLKNELTAVNQYFIHYRMAQHWGYTRLAQVSYQKSIDEMKHADMVIDRLLSLGGSPNMSDYDKINVGKDVREQLRNDLDLELRAIPYLNDGIRICVEEGDNTTRELLERFLIEEEAHAEWLETQLNLIEDIGAENYLANQIDPAAGAAGH